MSLRVVRRFRAVPATPSSSTLVCCVGGPPHYPQATAIADVNRDGRNDLVIGAPFEPGSEPGTEVIGHGPAQAPLVAGSKQPAAAVAPSSWPVTISFPPIAATPGPGAV